MQDSDNLVIVLCAKEFDRENNQGIKDTTEKNEEKGTQQTNSEATQAAVEEITEPSEEETQEKWLKGNTFERNVPLYDL